MRDWRAPTYRWAVIAASGLTLVWSLVAIRSWSNQGYFGYESDGHSMVTGLTPGRPAESGGLRVGDRIVEVEGRDGLIRPGQEVTFVVERGGRALRLEITAGSLPLSVQMDWIVHAGMGLLFLLGGLVAYFATGSTVSIIFLVSGIGKAIHDAGPPNTGSILLGDIFYSIVLLAMMSSAALLFHFTLLFPSRWNIVSKKAFVVILHGLFFVTAVLVIIKTAMLAFELDVQTLGDFIYTLALIPTYLGPLLACAVIVIRFLRADSSQRRILHLNEMLVGILLPTTVYFAAVVLETFFPSVDLPWGLSSYHWALLYVLVPITFTFAILKNQGGWPAGTKNMPA